MPFSHLSRPFQLTFGWLNCRVSSCDVWILENSSKTEGVNKCVLKLWNTARKGEFVIFKS